MTEIFEIVSFEKYIENLLMVNIKCFKGGDSS